MPWFRIDDKLFSNKKVTRIPRRRRAAAIGLWTLLGAWCAQELSDGHVPDHMVDEMGGTPQQVKDLVEVAELWQRTDTGFTCLNWHEYQPTREDTEQKREQARERMRRVRDSSPRVRANNGELRAKFANGSLTPTRPDPTIEQDSLRSSMPRNGAANTDRGTRLTDEWLPDASVRQEMADQFPQLDLKVEHAKFVDHWVSKTGKDATKRDWNRTWRNWVREAASRAGRWQRPDDHGSSAAGLPWTPEPAPRDIEDDPVASDRWYRDQVAKHNAGSR